MFMGADNLTPHECGHNEGNCQSRNGGSHRSENYSKRAENVGEAYSVSMFGRDFWVRTQD